MKKYYPSITAWPPGEVVMVENNKKGSYVLASDAEKALIEARDYWYDIGWKCGYNNNLSSYIESAEDYAKRVMEETK